MLADLLQIFQAFIMLNYTPTKN